MSPNKKFELDVSDIEKIETCIHKEINRLFQQKISYSKKEDEFIKEIDEKTKDLHELLGKLHSQKIWFRPKKNYVGG